MNDLPKSFLLIAVSAVLFVGLLFTIQLRSNRTLFRQVTPESTTQETITFIPLYESDPVIGNRGADITIVAFEDFLCEGCRAQNTLLNQLLETYPNRIKVVWKDLSITTIPQSSELIHVFGYCMNEQKLFQEYKDALFQTYIDVSQSSLESITRELGANMNQLSRCLTDGDAYEHLDKNKTLAQALNIQSVPTFFVDDTQVNTPSSISGWETILGL